MTDKIIKPERDALDPPRLHGALAVLNKQESEAGLTDAVRLAALEERYEALRKPYAFALAQASKLSLEVQRLRAKLAAAEKRFEAQLTVSKHLQERLAKGHEWAERQLAANKRLKSEVAHLTSLLHALRSGASNDNRQPKLPGLGDDEAKS